MAEDTKTNLYDGLFLISPHEMGGDLSAALEHIQGMLDRAGAETLSLRKWDERQLAYPIGGQKRGVYLLAIFRVAPRQIANVQRDCNLSEMVMRELILSADHLGDAEIEQEANWAQTTQDQAQLSSDQQSEGPGAEPPSEAQSMAQPDAGVIPGQGSTEDAQTPQPAGAGQSA